MSSPTDSPPLWVKYAGKTIDELTNVIDELDGTVLSSLQDDVPDALESQLTEFQRRYHEDGEAITVVKASVSQSQEHVVGQRSQITNNHQEIRESIQEYRNLKKKGASDGKLKRYMTKFKTGLHDFQLQWKYLEEEEMMLDQQKKLLETLKARHAVDKTAAKGITHNRIEDIPLASVIIKTRQNVLDLVFARVRRDKLIEKKISELEAELDQTKSQKQKSETNLNGKIKKLEEAQQESEKSQANLKKQIKQLEDTKQEQIKQLEDTKQESKKSEASLKEKIKKLEEANAELEKDAELGRILTSTLKQAKKKVVDNDVGSPGASEGN